MNKITLLRRKILAFIFLIIIFFGIPLFELYNDPEYIYYGITSGFFHDIKKHVLSFNIFQIWFLFLVFELLALKYKKIYDKCEYLILRLITILIALYILLQTIPSLYVSIVVIYWSIRQFITNNEIRKIWIMTILISMSLTVFDYNVLNELYYKKFGKIVNIELITTFSLTKNTCMDYLDECKFIKFDTSTKYNCIYGCSKNINLDNACESSSGSWRHECRLIEE